MRIWNYDPITGRVLSEGRADPSPLEPGVWLVPANATSIQPPETSAGQAAVWNGLAWQVIALPPAPEPEPEPEPAPPPLRNVSLRALLRTLAAMGFISRAEALAAARTGDIPASLRAPLLAGVDEDAAYEIELAWAAMYEAERGSPFWAFVVTAGIATEEQIDEVFRQAAAA